VGDHEAEDLAEEKMKTMLAKLDVDQKFSFLSV